MSTHNDGGPAFPLPDMTLCDYFAAKAMQSIIHSKQYQYGGFMTEIENLEGIVEDAYKVAYAMLKAREA